RETARQDDDYVGIWEAAMEILKVPYRDNLPDRVRFLKGRKADLNRKPKEVYLKVQGTSRSAPLTTTTLVSSGQGRLASVSVIVAGSTDGIIYDSSAVGTLTNAIAVVDNLLGVTVINMPYNSGLVVFAGAG
ncbi:MAG: hypothetical protein JZU63_14320, partial [Rhodoferax sp.]|nr:hypothetical protein [Rhodoferax sp.]